MTYLMQVTLTLFDVGATANKEALLDCRYDVGTTWLTQFGTDSELDCIRPLRDDEKINRMYNDDDSIFFAWAIAFEFTPIPIGFGAYRGQISPLDFVKDGMGDEAFVYFIPELMEIGNKYFDAMIEHMKRLPRQHLYSDYKQATVSFVTTWDYESHRDYYGDYDYSFDLCGELHVK